MRNGAVFPPIVCYPVAGKLVIIDGNNRQAAARKANLDTISGIVIAEDTPSEIIAVLTVEANARHGVTPDPAWRVQQAFYLCSLGCTDERAAESASISVTQLRSARAVQAADQRARSLKIHGFADLAAATRQNLGGLRDEAVFYQASKLAVDTGMTLDEVRELTRAVKTMASEGDRIAHIGTVSKTRGLERATRRAAGGKGHGRVHSPKTALASAIGKILAVDPAILARQIVTTHDRDTINHRLVLLKRHTQTLELAMATLAHLDDANAELQET
jgi:hypothetical protein